MRDDVPAGARKDAFASDADPIERLTLLLAKLPGVGRKTASRLTFFMMRTSESYVRELAEALVELRTRIRPCEICCNLTAVNPCSYCTDPRRSDECICVVEQPQDLVAIERSGEYRGRFHILHGSISPLDGVGPDDLKIQELVDRVARGGVSEIIIATDPDVEGEATALYLARLLKPLGVVVSRLAHGVPVGSELEYVDHVTIQKALDNRRPL